jgi:glycosyltransferase involved in cell wall biosynthesis
MKFVFFKHQLTFPRQTGHDVHSAEMMRALAAKGHPVVFLSRVPPEAGALDGLGLASAEVLAAEDADQGFTPEGLQARFFSYWGIDPRYAAAVASACRRHQADVLVSVGLDALPYLVGSHHALRVWYAADEWVAHHLSQLRIFDRSTWFNVHHAAVKGVYQQAFARRVDRVWVVTERDRWAARWIAGIRGVDVVPNGVDTEYFSPRPVKEQTDSAVFWGRLDFGPNIQGLEWFVRSVWPAVRRARPDAVFRIIGFKPGEAVRRLAAQPGVILEPDLVDLRDQVCRQAVVVVPMVSGLGIKNKLLEAAAMGRAVLCTSRATLGLNLPATLPMVVANAPGEWVAALLALWEDPARRHALGEAARRWVTECHSWASAADRALRGIEASLTPASSRS